MTKLSGLGWAFYVDGYDLSGDTAALGRMSTPQATLPSTGIDKSGMERLGGQRDGAIEWTSWFNDAALQQHAALKAVSASDVVLLAQSAATVGAPAVGMIGKQTNYAPSRSEAGALQFSVPAAANGFGAEWGAMLTAGKRTDTTATASGTGLDTTASLSFGAQLYLEVFSFTGTSVTVKLQDSADNSTFADVTGGSFAAATGRSSQRIQTGPTQTVRRYLRVATTGTFTNAVFAVMCVKNDAATTF